MRKQRVIKEQIISFFQIRFFVLAVCLASSCSVPPPPPQKNKHNPTWSKTGTIPACFSITASLNYVGSNDSYRCQVYCCVEHDKQIHFVVRGPFGIEVVRGVMNEKGVTILDRLHRLVHQWDYEQIKQHYHVHCNYQLIQSLLLGTTCKTPPFRNDQGLLVTPSESRNYLHYTYDRVTGKVIGTQLMDGKGNNRIKFLYKRSDIPLNSFIGIAGIKIDFSLNDNHQPYKGMMIYYNLRFSSLSTPNIKLKVPSYYKHK
ncbi:DUF4292 domain-containing protein [Cardinium endosymbiont of Tipula unca]|uniref:DUF4292 domain-containing protein n=1 Tax=Cardinium endosymbiont of Tipula unca TaxID=3066216 RepID=UPI0030D438E7